MFFFTNLVPISPIGTLVRCNSSEESFLYGFNHGKFFCINFKKVKSFDFEIFRNLPKHRKRCRQLNCRIWSPAEKQKSRSLVGQEKFIILINFKFKTNNSVL